jgi:hypothetical protein
MNGGPARRALGGTVKVVRWRDLFYVGALAAVGEEVARATGGASAAGILMGAAATFAALLVPAAALVRDHVRSAESAVYERVLDPALQIDDPERERRRVAQAGMISDLREALAPMLRGFLWMMLAFSIAAIDILGPDETIGQLPRGWIKPQLPVTVGTILTGLIVSLLLIAIWSFYPLTWEMLRRDNLHTLEAVLAHPLPSGAPAEVGEPADPGAGATPVAATTGGPTARARRSGQPPAKPTP